MATRTIDPAKVLADVRAGMDYVPIMEKYLISADELMAILKQYEADKAKKAAAKHTQTQIKATDKPQQRRSVARNYAFLAAPIYDANTPRLRGTVNDITEKGLQVRGIKTDVGETRTFLIRSNKCMVSVPFVLDASCIWVTTEEKTGDFVAGFEITNISPRGREELRKFVKEMTVSERLQDYARRALRKR